jgi:very-short-patch-repair endonuclease
MAKLDDFINKVFGCLTCIEKTNNKTSYGEYLFKCVCLCGNIVYKDLSRNPCYKDCEKCGVKIKLDDRFGILTVIAINGKRANCLCECGRERVFQQSNLLTHNNTSCGQCGYKNRQTAKKHSKDYSGQVFGRLKLLSRHMKDMGRNLPCGKRYRRAFYKCLCECGKIKLIEGTSITQGKVQSCGCLHAELARNRGRDKILGTIFNQLTVVEYSHSVNTNYGKNGRGVDRIWKCQCSCGKFGYFSTHTLTTGNTKTCGQCKVPNIGEKYCNLKVVNTSRHFAWGGRIECLCKCGQLWSGEAKRWGKIKSCGKCARVYYPIGFRNGKLVITKHIITSLSNTGLRLECKCDCGKQKKFTLYSFLLRQTCGDCCLMRHGQKISKPQLKLSTVLFRTRFNKRGIINFPTGKRLNIDLAVMIEGRKIAIEYDAWFWHSHRLDYDKKRTIKLIKGGWSVIRIKSNSKMPLIKTLESAIEYVLHNKKAKCVYLSDWGKGITFKEMLVKRKLNELKIPA